MTIEIKVPVLPESVADATVSVWHKKVGDKVVRDENLLDLETDKVVLEVPAPADGVLENIIIPAGQTVTSGTVLGVLGAGSGTAAVVVQPTTTAAQPSKQLESPSVKSEVGPAARRAAAEADVDPDQVSGTGKKGRVTKEDVKNQASNVGLKQTTLPSSSNNGREEKRVPMTRLRQTIANRLLAVKQQTAMLTTFNEVNLQAVMDIRNKYKDQFE